MEKTKKLIEIPNTDGVRKFKLVCSGKNNNLIIPIERVFFDSLKYYNPRLEGVDLGDRIIGPNGFLKEFNNSQYGMLEDRSGFYIKLNRLDDFEVIREDDQVGRARLDEPEMPIIKTVSIESTVELDELELHNKIEYLEKEFSMKKEARNLIDDCTSLDRLLNIISYLKK